MWGDFSEGVGKLIPEGETFDFVFDNYAKDVETCQDLAAKGKEWYVLTVGFGYIYFDSFDS